MRVISPEMEAAWKAEDKTGPNRPVIRATIQKCYNRHFQYDTFYAPGGDLDHQNHRKGSLRSLVMGEPSAIREVRNIRRFSWQRSVNQDVAEATLTLRNTELRPMGATQDEDDDFDFPGYMTQNRGNTTLSANRWGYNTQTGWNKIMAPDRMVKTYEGHGFDPAVEPALDGHLLQSGVWLIEDVTYTSSGDIELKMYDLAIMLTRQIAMPPVVAWEDYPLFWSKIRTASVTARDATGGSWVTLTGKKATATSSNASYVGAGLTNPPFPSYVGTGGIVDGHAPNHVLDSRDGTYWVSTGQDAWDDKVWWQANLKDSSTPLNAIRVQPYGGPYQVYVSLHNGTKWLGRKKIPYSPGVGGVDVDADIPFVMTAQLDKGRVEDLILPRKYGSIAKIRLTLTRLQDADAGLHRFRGGLRKVSIYTAGSVGALGFGSGTVTRTVGNYSDFTDIIKWVCGWAGFYWPGHDTGYDFIQPTASSNPAGRIYLTYATPDPKLASGRIWGDFQNTGTAGEADLTMDLFDKKPLMDQISYIRDLTGFVFFIDETGGVVWRLPNLYSLGNYVSPSHLAVRSRSRTSDIVVVDEEETLLSLDTKLSSKNMRDRVFVADTSGKTGTVVRGFVPNFSGFRRVAGWTDQHFATKRECIVMADMIVARQMFDYHRSNFRIPANPAIQIDDQIRLYERVTNETFYHYVESISSSIDMDAGTWFYDIESHWLGESPTDAWAVKVLELKEATRNYLNGLF